MGQHKKPVTLKILAEILGLTPATISKALRDSSDIAIKTRIRVKEKAEELGYRANIMARSLKRSRSHMLGVVVPDLRISFFTEVTRGIYEQARILGYEAIILVHDESASVEKRNIEFLSALNVDGILINAVPGTKNNDLIKRIHDRGVPFLCYDRIIDGLDFPSVTIDDENAAFKVIEYFVQSQRNNIVFLGPIKNLFVARGRYKGYRKALKLNCIEYRSEYVVTCQINEEDAYLKMKQFIESGRKCDAVLCIGGLVAYGAGQAILDAGMSIPGDILLAEFGDNTIVHRLGVPFVTVNQFPYQMGQKAVEMIVDSIESKGEHPVNKQIVISTELIYYHADGKF